MESIILEIILGMTSPCTRLEEEQNKAKQVAGARTIREEYEIV